MIFWRKLLLVLFTLVLGAGQLLAATRAERDYAAAVAAFNDGIYDRAESELTQFIETHPNFNHVAEAVLLKGQAQFKQGKFTEAITTLSAPAGDWGNLADQYAYWLGEAQYAQGKFEQAATTFTNLAARFPASQLCLTAVVEAAAAYERLGDWPALTGLLSATNGVFGKMAAQDSANELVSRGRLLLARAEFVQNDFTAARVTLSLLDPQSLPPDLDWQRSSLLCQVELGANNLNAALAESTNLVAQARQQKDAAPKHLAESMALRATILERMKLWPEAAAVWSQNLTNPAPAEWQRQAVLKLAENAVAQNNFTNAMTSLAEYLQRFTNSPVTGLAMLTLGELNLREFVAAPAQTNYLFAAQEAFDRLLATNSAAADLAGKAYLDRGWCGWLTGQTNKSLADFRAAADRLPVSEDLAVAKFKTGDVLYALQDYAGARASYQSVLAQFAGSPRVMASLGDRALYQVVRTSVKLQDKAGAEQAMRQLLDRFPKSELRDNAELLLAEGIFDFDSANNAAAVFRDFAERFPDSPLRPQAELDMARTYERGQDWPAAITGYAAWLERFPTNELRPQVEYALGRAEFQAGNETNALGQFTQFVAQFPGNELAPMAQWWVADYYFRQGGINVTNYAEAEKNYESIFQNTNVVWRQSELFYPAQLMAGRAAAGRLGFSDAVRYFTAMTTDANCPEALKNQALFACGGVLMRWDSPDTNRPTLNLEKAADIFTGLGQANPTNELGALALSELGDCELQLGAFADATNAYGQVIQSPYASVGLRSRAQVGLGTVLEKMAAALPPEQQAPLLKEARDHYLNVFETGFGKGLADHEFADAFWVKKAGLAALPLLSADNIYPANFFTTMETLLPQLKDQLEKKRAALQK